MVQDKMEELDKTLLNIARSSYYQVLIDITDYVFHYPTESSRAWQHALYALLDALGCAVESLCLSSECNKLVGPVVPGTLVPNGFCLPGTSYQLEPVKGAFDLGLLIRYLDHNDAYSGAKWGHPSDNLGVIIATMDWLSRTRVSESKSIYTGPSLKMRTLLAAQIKAYEIPGCFQTRNSFNAVGLDHTILVKIASTALVSWILGLSEPQTLAALSQAWQDGHPLRTFHQSPNAGPRKGWQAGDACMRAVQLALITCVGQPGSPTVLTALKWGFYATLFKDNRFVLLYPYRTWVMENVFFKMVVAEGHGVTAIKATLQLSKAMREQSLVIDYLENIYIRTHKAAYTIIDKPGPSNNAADRDHCMQYMLAVVLLKGDLIEAPYYSDTSEWTTDPRVDNLRGKMQMVEDKQFTADYHDPKIRSASSGVTILMKDSRQLDEVVVEYPTGHPWRSDTLSKVEGKIRKNLALKFRETQINAILMAVEVEDLEVHQFMDLFAEEARASL